MDQIERSGCSLPIWSDNTTAGFPGFRVRASRPPRDIMPLDRIIASRPVATRTWGRCVKTVPGNGLPRAFPNVAKSKAGPGKQMWHFTQRGEVIQCCLLPKSREEIPLQGARARTATKTPLSVPKTLQSHNPFLIFKSGFGMFANMIVV